MKSLLLTALSIFALGGCAEASMADQEHTVAEYLADAQLSADTVLACQASSEAEALKLAAKPACKNVREAEQRRWSDAVHRATGVSAPH